MHSDRDVRSHTILGDPGADHGADGKLGREGEQQHRGRGWGQGEIGGKQNSSHPALFRKLLLANIAPGLRALTDIQAKYWS